ncbi:nucleoid DNA-binding protein [Modicisalibacter xianhensis]|uniref:Nucleoid DNA-binding protein n=1 Tax=Modicisalibacter xianhensis TaxID=442341 RepID=A0A4R8F8W2_9GAMM|nr:HU family DNA-binding protein [Halomonas xianhensis]TDX21642.1 nucleoid DNA-binding protein [Halomonas xianhensis]
MNWQDHVDRTYRVAKRWNPEITRNEVILVMRSMRAIFFQAAKDNEEIFWPGFFRINYRQVPERMAWNPAKRERYLAPAKTSITFKLGGNLKAAANREDVQDDPA